MASASTSAAPANLRTVSSPDHFKSLLSEDLERVSVLYFYADWAEPCAAMTQAVQALADANPAVLFLVIEAEALPEISESFEVDAVPYTIILRVSLTVTHGTCGAAYAADPFDLILRFPLRTPQPGSHLARTGLRCTGPAAGRRDYSTYIPRCIRAIQYVALFT